MSSLMGLEPCGFHYMPLHVCALVCVYVTHSHRCCRPHRHGQHQLLCGSNVHLSPIITLFLSHALALCVSLTHTSRCYRPKGCRHHQHDTLLIVLEDPGRGSDHNFMGMLIYADVVQFGKGSRYPYSFHSSALGLLYSTFLLV